MLLFVILSKITGQLKSEQIDQVLKSRFDYISDSIPDIFKTYYERFTQTCDKPVFDTLKFYDLLKTILLEKSFPEKNFLWFEYLTDDFCCKDATIYTDQSMVFFRREWIAQWDRRTPDDDGVSYTLETSVNLKNFVLESYLSDFIEWNEYVTNRSYLYSPGAGFIFCSKVTIKSDQMEIVHTAFRSFTKNYPFFYLKEQSVDDYNIRLQVNCDWITEDRLEEVVWGLIGAHKEHGFKVFDCEGNEIELEQHSE